jgi:hypothetical protein
VDEYKLDVPISRCGSDDHEYVQDWWQGFLADVTYTKGRYQFRHKVGARMLPGSSVTLKAERRAEIHALVAKIRKVVAVLNVSEDKRDAIYGRLAGLAKEDERSKTFYGTLMSSILETSGTLGEAAEKLDPLARLMHGSPPLSLTRRPPTSSHSFQGLPSENTLRAPDRNGDWILMMTFHSEADR